MKCGVHIPPVFRARVLCFLAALAVSVPAAFGAVDLPDDRKALRDISALYKSTGTLQEYISVQLAKFIKDFPASDKAGVARFLQGEVSMDRGLALQADANKIGSPNGKGSASYGKFGEAIERYLDAAKLDSTLADSANYRQGEALYNQQEWEQSVTVFKKVVSGSPGYLDPESMLGIIYAKLALKKNEEAALFYDELLKKHPDYAAEPGGLLAGGFLALEKGDYETAGKRFAQVNTPEARFYMACLDMFHNKPYLAAATFEKLRDEYPGSGLDEKSDFLIGDSFFRSSDYEGAQAKFQRFAERYPKSVLLPSAVFRVGACQFKRGNNSEAAASFKGFLEKFPADKYAAYAQYFMGEALRQVGQYKDAAEAYAAVIDKFPPDHIITPLSYLKVAWCRYTLTQYDESVGTVEAFLAKYPSDDLGKYAYVLIGKAYIAQNRYESAFAAFYKLADLFPASQSADQAILYILKTQYDSGNYAAVTSTFKQTSGIKQPSGSFFRGMCHIYAGEAYYNIGLYDEAAAVFDSALKNFTDVQVGLHAQNGLAWCRLAAGDAQAALKGLIAMKRQINVSGITVSSITLVNEFDIANGLFNEKKYEDAYQLYSTYAHETPRGPQSAAAIYRAGLALYSLKYYSQAVETWKEISGDKNTAESKDAALIAADTYFRAQKYKEAIAAYNQIIKNNPQSVNLQMANFRIAQSAYNDRNYPLTISQVQTLVNNYPTSQEALDSLELLEGVFDQSPDTDYADVLGDIATKHEGTPVGGEASLKLGVRLFAKKSYANSIYWLNKFSATYTHHPKLAQAQLYIGEAYLLRKKYKDAATVFERVANNFSDKDIQPLALFRLGSLKYGMRDYDASISAFRRLMDAYPDSEYSKLSYFNIGLAYRASNKLDLAEEYYKKFLGLSSADVENNKLACWEIFSIRKDAGDLPGAMGQLKEILTRFNDDDTVIEVYSNMGELYASNKQAGDAKAAFEELEGKKPYSNQFRIRGLIKLAQIYEDSKDFRGAIRLYRDIAKNSEDKKVSAAAGERADQLRDATQQDAQQQQEQEQPRQAASEGEQQPQAEAAPEQEQAPAKKKKKSRKNKRKKAAQQQQDEEAAN
ncbi:MAG: tetratricopeptide repeat protein [Elusimicrobiales bacterium]